MNLGDERPNGTIAAAIKQVPAEQPPPPPEIPKLLDVLVKGFTDGTGHDTELGHLLD